MEKKKTCFYLACLTVGSLAATMVLVLIYKFAYFNVYGIDITHCIGFNEVLVSCIVPWLRILAFILFLILMVKCFYVPYTMTKSRKKSKDSDVAGIADGTRIAALIILVVFKAMKEWLPMTVVGNGNVVD